MAEDGYSIKEFIEMQARLTAEVYDEREKRYSERAMFTDKALELAEKHADMHRKAAWGYLIGIVGMLLGVLTLIAQWLRH